MSQLCSFVNMVVKTMALDNGIIFLRAVVFCSELMILLSGLQVEHKLSGRVAAVCHLHNGTGDRDSTPFLWRKRCKLFVTGILSEPYALNVFHCPPTERGSFPLPAETESQHPTEVPAGEGGAWSSTAQLLCLLQGQTHLPALSM